MNSELEPPAYVLDGSGPAAAQPLPLECTECPGRSADYASENLGPVADAALPRPYDLGKSLNFSQHRFISFWWFRFCFQFME